MSAARPVSRVSIRMDKLNYALNYVPWDFLQIQLRASALQLAQLDSTLIHLPVSVLLPAHSAIINLILKTNVFYTVQLYTTKMVWHSAVLRAARSRVSMLIPSIISARPTVHRRPTVIPALNYVLNPAQFLYLQMRPPTAVWVAVHQIIMQTA